MTTTSGGFGLRPVYHAQGGEIRTYGYVNGIASGYAANIYSGDRVVMATSGYLEQATTTGGAIGVFVGVSYTDSNGLPPHSIWVRCSGSPRGGIAEHVPQLTVDSAVERVGGARGDGPKRTGWWTSPICAGPAC